MDNCGFVETKKGQTSLLFYCTVHSIMWTIRNSKALGKTKQLLFVGYLIVFNNLDEWCLLYLFPTRNLRCLMKSLTHSNDKYWPKYCRVLLPMKFIWKLGKIFFFIAIQCLRCTHTHTHTNTNTHVQNNELLMYH